MAGQTPRRLPLAGRPSLGNANNNVGTNNHKNNTKNLTLSSSYTMQSQQKSSSFSSNGGSPSDLARKASWNALTGGQDTPRASPVAYAKRSTMDAPQDSDIAVGDAVEVPGGMTGTVKYVGAVKGKNGIFAGVELSQEFASRGKNDGDVEGTKYFRTSIPGSGIFLPAHRAQRQDSPTFSASTQPSTPTTPSVSELSFSRPNGQGATNITPPTPSASKLSQSVGPGSRPNFSKTIGPGSRAQSPQIKPKGRPSLPRPESPVRKNQQNTAHTPGRATPGAGFSQSVRGGRPPALNSITKTPTAGSKTRTPSRPGSRSQSRTGDRTSDPDTTPTVGAQRFGNSLRAPSSKTTRSSSFTDSASNEENRLRRNLGERDKQLKEQAASLAEMESSLAELQSMVAENSKFSQQNPSLSRQNSSNADEGLGSDAQTLRQQLREKNEKIAMLTAEFDNHRADFRSTIDTLEMASTETERVYEKRVEELVQEVQELQEQQSTNGNEGGGDASSKNGAPSASDFEAVARQLKHLEEVVQELEEGLEDARRGEAEANSELEFLRGEVERGRTELRREREKAAAVNGINGNVPSQAREVEQRDDEIRGLKAIIHSLSSSGGDSGVAGGGSPRTERQSSRTSSLRHNSASADPDSAKLRASMEMLSREKSELQGLVDRKTFREEELERQIAELKAAFSGRGSGSTGGGDALGALNGMGMRGHSDSLASSTRTAIRPGSGRSSGGTLANAFPQPPTSAANGGGGGFSGGFGGPGGPGGAQSPNFSRPSSAYDYTAPAPLQTSTSKQAFSTPMQPHAEEVHQPVSPVSPDSGGAPPPLSSFPSGPPAKTTPPNKTPPPLPPQQEDNKQFVAVGDGPAPGKASQRVDMSKWCALCERDGHESVDCPFEEF
ncbi:MAG: hypothetical protein M1831_000435 [Alyxoria varia]|nr:MAG: hypothetical protein M1831_000435 [Alyxoria varia]